MLTQTKGNHKVITGRLTMPVSFLLAAIFLSACAPGRYGSFEPNRDVNDSFNNHEVLPDYQYYYTGPQSRPNALLGVRKEYTLISEFWQSFSPTSEQLEDIVARMNDYYDLPVFGPYGAYIVNPNGERVGIWYSKFDYTPVKFEAHKIEIYTPNVFQLRRKEMQFLQNRSSP